MTWSMYTQSYKAYLASLEASTIGNTGVAWNESYWLLDYSDIGVKIEINLSH